MARKAKLLILIICCAAVIAVIKGIINPLPGPAVKSKIAQANANLDEIEEALAAHDGPLPTGSNWATEIGLNEAFLIDPFHFPDQPEPFGYWSDGKWYVLTSNGPDVYIGVEMMDWSLDPEATLESSRQFNLGLFQHRSPDEIEALLGNVPSKETIISDIRTRDSIFDATNGHLSPGDIVRWGRVTRTEEFTYDTTNGTISESRVYRVRQ